jgi:hypothetical protein
MTLDTPLIYRSYLLRLWQVREETGLAWRATLVDVKTGEQCGFASLEDLTNYLQQVTNESLEEDEA